MTFANAFLVDEVTSKSSSKKMADFGICPGTYNQGIISVLDESLSDAALESWRWLLGQDAVALMATSIGDLFFWSEKNGAIYFLDVQRGQSTFVDRDIIFVLNRFLSQNEIQDRVLRRDLFNSLSAQLGKLMYEECFIAEPWLRHGGSGDVSTYAKGSLVVYLNLVGQAVEHSMRLERARAK
ncbi:T6SS immunity protein Tdi1 domain-containing protein [Cupriavidus sp. 8B]